MHVTLDYSVGKVDLFSRSHDIVSEVLKNRGSANSRLRRRGSLEDGGCDVTHILGARVPK